MHCRILLQCDFSNIVPEGICCTMASFCCNVVSRMLPQHVFLLQALLIPVATRFFYWLLESWGILVHVRQIDVGPHSKFVANFSWSTVWFLLLPLPRQAGAPMSQQRSGIVLFLHVPPPWKQAAATSIISGRPPHPFPPASWSSGEAVTVKNRAEASFSVAPN